jgi:Ca2+-binding RTX toxin-like protein
LAATLVLSAAAPQAQADGASVEVSGGNLQIAHDPGTYGGLTVYYYPASPGGASYSVRAGWIPAGPGPPGPMSTPVRSSTCQQTGSGTVSCPASGVSSIVIDAGDGDDGVGVGVVPLTNAPETAPIPVPVQVSLGDGNDSTYLKMGQQPVSVDGGNGNDGMDTGAGVTTGRFLGGAGDDSMGIAPGAIDTTFLGGPGSDSIEGESTGVAVADGEGDGDSFRVKHTSGTLKLLGGDGDDSYRMSDVGSGRSARTEVRAGPGDDTIEPRLRFEGGRDLLDCGPGADLIELRAEGATRSQLLNHSYIDCPIVAFKVKRPRLEAGRRGPRATMRLSASQAGKGKVIVKRLDRRGRTVFRSRGVRVKLVAGRSSKVAVKVPKKFLGPAQTRLEVLLNATSASGDRARLQDRVVFKR